MTHHALAALLDAAHPDDEARGEALGETCDEALSEARNRSKSQGATEPGSAGRPRELAPIRAAVAAEPALREAHAPDTWAVIAALAAEFDGTLPELFTTAAAAAMPAPVAATTTPTKPARNKPVGN